MTQAETAWTPDVVKQTGSPNLDDNLKIDVDVNEAGTITLVVNGQQVVSREVTADELNAGKAVLDLSSLNIESGKLTEGADNPNSIKSQ